MPHAAMEGSGAQETISVMSEVKKQLRLAVPLIVGCFLQRVILTISIMFAGHLGDELALASASLATSFAGVTGFYVMTGMAGSLDTLCGQAFGARQHRLVGVYKERAMLVFSLVSIPISVIWFFSGEILVLCGQNPEIAAGAESYMRWMIPALLLFGLLQCHVEFLQVQNIVVPVMLSAGITAVAHVAICWLLVFKLGLGANGAALAVVVSTFINLSLLAFYIRFSPLCKATWAGFSREAFCDIPRFLKLAVSSAFMLCFEFWAFEILVLLSGLLPNPKLETAVLSICFNIYLLAFMVPTGLGFAVSIRVSNELGAGRPQTARLATRVVMLLSLSTALVVSLVMVLSRKQLGYAFSNVEEVVSYYAKMMPLLAVSFLFDSMQGVLSGVLRGCGLQKMGASVNFAAYYLVGVPAASVFAFVCHLRTRGLWLGISCGIVVQVLSFLSTILCTNWNKQALKAKDRLFNSVGKEAQGTTEAANGFVEG